MVEKSPNDSSSYILVESQWLIFLNFAKLTFFFWHWYIHFLSTTEPKQASINQLKSFLKNLNLSYTWSAFPEVIRVHSGLWLGEVETSARLWVAHVTRSINRFLFVDRSGLWCCWGGKRGHLTSFTGTLWSLWFCWRRRRRSRRRRRGLVTAQAVAFS